MNFDRFEIRIDPAKFMRWTGGGGFQPVEVVINGTPLLEMVRTVEEPFVHAERQARIDEGEDPSEISSEPGGYFCLPPSLMLLPSRNLLDEPWDHGFILPPGDPRFGKSTVLGCSCSVIECWFVLVRITLTPGAVEWSDFSQFHRDWRYELGPFIFERTRYEAELAKRAE